jgi:hypothetical protein
MSCSSGTVTVSNIGNIDVYGMDIRKYYESEGLTEIQISTEGVRVGRSVSITLERNGISENCPENFEGIPKILATSESGASVAYTCLNNIFSG